MFKLQIWDQNFGEEALVVSFEKSQCKGGNY